MREKVVKLRLQGRKHREIAEELGLSVRMVGYYCRKTIVREKIPDSVRRKVRNLTSRITAFQRRGGQITSTFSYKDVIEREGIATKCYVSGEIINLTTDNLCLDHIIPPSRGGTNSIDNLGITTPRVNLMKSDMLLSELLELSKKILENNGYVVSKIESEV